MMPLNDTPPPPSDITRPLAVVLLSGGLDSCVTASIAALTHRLAFLHLNYGQRTQAREEKAFHDLATHFDAPHRLVIDVDHLSRIGGSSLTDPLINVTPADLGNPAIPSSYVPFRNANILAMATSWAEVLGANAIFIGAVSEDSSGYPDCRPEFFEAFNRVIATGTRPETRITIETPIIHLAKAEIVKKGIQLNAPLHLTWSCYQAENEACGVCDSCALRLRGFARAGIPDPIPYQIRPDYA